MHFGIVFSNYFQKEIEHFFKNKTCESVCVFFSTTNEKVLTKRFMRSFKRVKESLNRNKTMMSIFITSNYYLLIKWLYYFFILKSFNIFSLNLGKNNRHYFLR